MLKVNEIAEYADACRSTITIAKIAKKMLPLMIVAVLSVSLASVGLAAAAEEEEALPDFGECEVRTVSCGTWKICDGDGGELSRVSQEKTCSKLHWKAWSYEREGRSPSRCSKEKNI